MPILAWRRRRHTTAESARPPPAIHEAEGSGTQRGTRYGGKTQPLEMRGLMPVVAREPYCSLSGLALAPWRLSPGCRAVAGPEPSRSLDIYTSTLRGADPVVKRKLTVSQFRAYRVTPLPSVRPTRRRRDRHGHQGRHTAVHRHHHMPIMVYPMRVTTPLALSRDFGNRRTTA